MDRKLNTFAKLETESRIQMIVHSRGLEVGRKEINMYHCSKVKRRKQRPLWLFARNLGIYDATPTEDGNVITVTMNKLPISGRVIKGPDVAK